MAADPYVPFCIAAVELAAEKMVVMGQVVPGVTVTTCTSATEVELVLDTLYEDDEHEYMVWKWRPVDSAGDGEGAQHADDKRVAVLGAGMHPWGKWGRNFVEYGVAAAGDALAEAGIEWTDVQYVAGADTIRNGYPGFVAGATFAQALGWTGARVSSAPTPPAPPGPRPSTTPGPRSSPGSATWPWWSAPTPRPRGSSPRSAATARTTRTGCASI